MIRLNNVSKVYKSKHNECRALNNINIEFVGGLYLIYGKSGSGKSTLLNIIQGYENPTEGSVEIDNPNLVFGFVPQNPKLFEAFTVKDNLEMLGNSITRICDCLDMVGLTEKLDETVNVLSSGEKQRLCIAQALLKNPNVLLLDEPTGNLDKNNSISIMEILKNISKNKIVIIVSHDYNLTSKYCDIEIELNKGNIVKNQVKHQVEKIDLETPEKLNVFSMKWRFIYTFNVFKRNIIISTASIILLSMLFLITIIVSSLVNINVNDSITKYYEKSNQDYSFIHKEEYNKYLDENYSISKGTKFYDQLNNKNLEPLQYHKFTGVVNGYVINTSFTLVLVPHDYKFFDIEGSSGVVITDFLAKQVYVSDNYISKDFEFYFPGLISGNETLKVTGVIKTNYTENEYQMFKNNSEYKTAHQDEYDYKYSMLFVDEEIYYNTLYGNNVKLQGSLIYNQTVTMKDYLNNSLTYNLYEEANDKILYGNKIESSNEVLIGKREYSKLYNGEAFEPRIFSYLDINASPNKNKYEEIFNIYDIKKEVKVVGVVEDKDANNIYISEEFYNDIYKEIHNYDLTGFLVKLPDDNLDKYISSTLDNGFFLGNSSHLFVAQINEFIEKFVFILPVFILILIGYVLLITNYQIKVHYKEIVMFRIHKVKKIKILSPFIFIRIFEGAVSILISTLIFVLCIKKLITYSISGVYISFGLALPIVLTLVVFLCVSFIGLIIPFLAIYRLNIGLALKETN